MNSTNCSTNVPFKADNESWAIFQGERQIFRCNKTLSPQLKFVILVYVESIVCLFFRIERVH